MTAPFGEILHDAHRRTGLSLGELWLGYYAVGGSSSPARLLAYLSGDAIPTPTDYDMVAQALNDALIDLTSEQQHVPYADDLDW